MSHSIVLSNFELGLIEPRFSQNRINTNFVKYMATAKCISDNIEEQSKANEILIHVKELVERYAVKEQYVASRCIRSLENESFLDSEDIKTESLPSVYQNLFESPEGGTIADRMQLFQDYTIEFLNEIYKEAIKPDEIIYVTSTGYHAPTPIQYLLNQKSWYDVEIKNCFNLDCYAAVPAVKMAMASLAEQENKYVDIVHTEIQSLHLDLLDDAPVNILINSLFGDGAVKYKASKAAEAGLEVFGTYEELIPNSLDQMGWKIGTHHFDMILSALVPFSIEEGIMEFLRTFARRCKKDLNDWIENAVWAIHPGGPKIVELVSEKMKLNDAQVRHSWEVLKNHGNMSSSTLPYIWKQIIEDDGIESGKDIISLAFGPGLTACALWMRKI